MAARFDYHFVGLWIFLLVEIFSFSPSSGGILRYPDSPRKLTYFPPENVSMNAFSCNASDVILGLENEDVVEIAQSMQAALSWVYNTVVPYKDLARIRAIAIGEEFKPVGSSISSYVLPACLNLYAAMKHFDLDADVKVSVPHSVVLLESVVPPSNGRFHQLYLSSFLHSFLQFLHESRSWFMLSLWSSVEYEQFIGSAISQTGKGFDDPKSGLHYSDGIDALLDALHTAMASIGYDDIPIVLIESRKHRNDYPRGTSRRDSVITYTKRGLTSHSRKETGSPLKPASNVSVFVREPSESKLTFGRVSMHASKILNVESNASKAATVSFSSAYGRSWCVAKTYANPDALQAALNWACGFGGADCSPIQPGSYCYVPNTIYSHASYAFNSYYQMNQHASGTCDFKGVATVTYEDPSYPGCPYPFRIFGSGQMFIPDSGYKDAPLFVCILLSVVLCLYRI